MNKKKRLAIVTPSMNVGGAEKVLVDLALAMDKENFEVKVFAIDHHKENQIVNLLNKSKVPIIFLLPRRNFIENYHAFSEELKKFAPDIVHTHMDFIYGPLWARLNSVPFVYTIHSQPYRVFNSIKYKLFFKMVLSKRDAITAISPIIAKELTDTLKFPESRVITIVNPVTVPAPTKKTSKRDNINFVCVARFHPIKNHKLLIKSFSDLLSLFSSAHLFLAGDGQLAEECKTLTLELGIENKVTFLGNVSNIPELLKNSDVFVLSSDSEAMPISILEAMAHSLPIIATKVGGVPDLVSNNGILVPKQDKKALTDAMLQLAQDADLRELYGSRSYDRVQEYKTEIIVSRYEELYNSLIKRSGFFDNRA